MNCKFPSLGRCFQFIGQCVTDLDPSAWMPNTDLTPISSDECKDVVEKGKSKLLQEAYGIAAQDHDLDHYKKMLAEHQEAMQEDLDRKADKEAKKAEKEGKKRRKSEVAADEMDIDEEEEGAPKSKITLCA